MSERYQQPTVSILIPVICSCSHCFTSTDVWLFGVQCSLFTVHSELCLWILILYKSFFFFSSLLPLSPPPQTPKKKDVHAWIVGMGRRNCATIPEPKYIRCALCVQFLLFIWNNHIQKRRHRHGRRQCGRITFFNFFFLNIYSNCVFYLFRAVLGARIGFSINILGTVHHSLCTMNFSCSIRKMNQIQYYYVYIFQCIPNQVWLKKWQE